MLHKGPMEAILLKNRKMIEQAAGLALMGLLIFFCLLVLKPFVTAMLWAAILVFASWPVFGFVKRRLAGGNAVVAAGLMTLLATLMLVKAEALEALGNPAAAAALRLDSQPWARYGFGPDSVVKARMRDIAAVAGRASGG